MIFCGRPNKMAEQNPYNLEEDSLNDSLENSELRSIGMESMLDLLFLNGVKSAEQNPKLKRIIERLYNTTIKALNYIESLDAERLKIAEDKFAVESMISCAQEQGKSRRILEIAREVDNQLNNSEVFEMVSEQPQNLESALRHIKPLVNRGVVSPIDMFADFGYGSPGWYIRRVASCDWDSSDK